MSVKRVIKVVSSPNKSKCEDSSNSSSQEKLCNQQLKKIIVEQKKLIKGPSTSNTPQVHCTQQSSVGVHNIVQNQPQFVIARSHPSIIESTTNTPTAILVTNHKADQLTQQPVRTITFFK